MKYEKAMAEVVEFDNSDVVTASVDTNLSTCSWEGAYNLYEQCGGENLWNNVFCTLVGGTNSIDTYSDTTPW